MLKKTVTAISVAALTASVAVLPTAVSAAQGVAPVQLAACNPCAAKKACNPCNPCAAKKACNPCNPCAAKKVSE
ncbi:MAG: hypothetical protein O3A96_02130 [Proteobacteria bacterium]|nr:hypothetical protein [Pseudomonadota bacterium]